MTPKEAFRAVLAHRNVRPVPWSIKFTAEAYERYAAHLGRQFDPVTDLGSYVVASHTNGGWPEVEPGHFRDYFGVVWNRTADRTLGVVDDPPLKSPNFAGYRFPDPDTIPVYDFVESNNRKYPDRFHMLSIGFSLFERAWSLVGMESLFMYLIEEPAFVGDLLDRITDYNLAVIRHAATLGGIDCIHFGDDWGSQRGPMIHPDMWREFIQPRYRAMCDQCKAAGLLVSLHCCGNVEPIMEDIHQSGTDVFDPFQPEAMDIWQLRERFRGRMAFWGGLSVQRTLPQGTPEQVRRETQRLLDEMAPGGGYVLSPSHSLTGDVPPENVDAFLEVAGADLRCPPLP
jgi:uroporphyrinogen decarboxylase